MLFENTEEIDLANLPVQMVFKVRQDPIVVDIVVPQHLDFGTVVRFSFNDMVYSLP
jgi:hypothetical protein